MIGAVAAAWLAASLASAASVSFSSTPSFEVAAYAAIGSAAGRLVEVVDAGTDGSEKRIEPAGTVR